MFLVLSQSGVHFGFDHSFFACPIRHANETARQRKWPLRKKFVHLRILVSKKNADMFCRGESAQE